jgi:ParB family transcriptional regulator, chromosome partitioning protein
MEKRALGKGLSALLPESGDMRSPGQEVQQIAMDLIVPNRFQPRTDFPETELLELAESLRQNGVLQPVLVRRKGDGFFELIAGERRFRAAKLAGIPALPAIVRNSSDQQAMELALVENLQRKDLNPMESARAYHRLINEFGFTQDAVAVRIGKDRSSIANLIRLMHLPLEIQDLVQSGALSTGHAKVILGLPTQDSQLALARRILAEQLSVRQAELLTVEQLQSSKPKRGLRHVRPHRDLEERLQKRLGTRVSLVTGRRGGKLVLHYFSPEELDRLIEMLLQ